VATILLVNDERISRTLLRVALERRRHEVIEAGSSRRALALAGSRQEPIDLVVAELDLPKTDGLELVESLRRRYPTLRAIFLSRSLAAQELESRARATGAAVLRQPFEMAAVVAAAEAQLAGLEEARKPPAHAGEPPKLRKAKSG
jgi:two-component system response regulator GlrR